MDVSSAREVLSIEFPVGSRVCRIPGGRCLECGRQGTLRLGCLYENPGKDVQGIERRCRCRSLSSLQGRRCLDGGNGVESLSIVRQLAARLSPRKREDQQRGPALL